MCSSSTSESGERGRAKRHWPASAAPGRPIAISRSSPWEARQTLGRRSGVRGRGGRVLRQVGAARRPRLGDPPGVRSVDLRGTGQPRDRGGCTCADQRRRSRPDAARARDSPARGGRLQQLAARQDAVGDRADGEVPPVEHLPEARCREQDRGKSLGAAQRAVVRRLGGRRASPRPRPRGHKRSGPAELTPGPPRFPARRPAGRRGAAPRSGSRSAPRPCGGCRRRRRG